MVGNLQGLVVKRTIPVAIDQANHQINILTKAIKKATRNRNPEFTLGQMDTILSLLKREKQVRSSLLL
jgi:hypothetical protein